MVSLKETNDSILKTKEFADDHEMKAEFSGHSNNAFEYENDSDARKKSYSTFDNSDNRNLISFFIRKGEIVILKHF